MNQQERDKYLAIEWTGPGWRGIIQELDIKMSKIDPEYTIEQIKEKFGGLRYYFYSNSDNADTMYDLENEYENLSFKICEYCGLEDDVTTEGGWLKTFCKNCRQSNVRC